MQIAIQNRDISRRFGMQFVSAHLPESFVTFSRPPNIHRHSNSSETNAKENLHKKFAMLDWKHLRRCKVRMQTKHHHLHSMEFCKLEKQKIRRCRRSERKRLFVLLVFLEVCGTFAIVKRNFLKCLNVNFECDFRLLLNNNWSS